MLKNYAKVIVEYGDKLYYNEKGQLHRLDGPAVEYKNGSKIWYINNNRHRNIDPSCEWKNGDKYWVFKNKEHRIGGIACYGLWYIHGKEYTKEQQYYNIVWEI